MNEKEYEKTLHRFGYTKPWSDSGVISMKLLELQIKDRASREDERDSDHFEHYRLGALRDYLTSHKELSNDQFQGLLKVAADEQRSTRPDTLRSVIFFDLTGHRELTDEQFDMIAEARDEEAFQRHVLCLRCLRGLRQGNRETEFIGRCVHEGDTVVHRCLLHLNCMNLPQLTWLAQNAVKEIRREGQIRLLELDNLSPALLTWLAEEGVNKDIHKRARRKQKGQMRG